MKKKQASWYSGKTQTIPLNRKARRAVKSVEGVMPPPNLSPWVRKTK